LMNTGVFQGERMKIYYSTAMLLLGLALSKGCTDPDVTGLANEQAAAEQQGVSNDTPAANNAPVIWSIPVTDVNVQTLYLYQAAANDPDQDTLLWSLPVAPAGLAVDPATGLVGAIALAAGTHNVTVRVEDGQGGSDSQSFSVTVNDGPVIYTTPAGYTLTGTPYRYNFGAVDPNGMNLVYNLTAGPAGILLDSDSGLFEWTPADAGNFEIGLMASNSVGKSVTQNFTLTVLPVDGVTIVSSPLTEGFVSEPYKYRVTTMTQTGVSINYLLANAPLRMTIGQQTGVIDWTPDAAGVFTVEVQAVRDNGYMATQNFSVRIRTLEEMDSMFNDILSGLFRNLGDGNTDEAMQYLSTEAQRRLGSALSDLSPFIDEVTASYSVPVRMSLHPEMAEYMIRRTADSGTRIYTVTFLLDFNGEWKINDL